MGCKIDRYMCMKNHSVRHSCSALAQNSFGMGSRDPLKGLGGQWWCGWIFLSGTHHHILARMVGRLSSRVATRKKCGSKHSLELLTISFHRLCRCPFTLAALPKTIAGAGGQGGWMATNYTPSGSGAMRSSERAWKDLNWVDFFGDRFQKEYKPHCLTTVFNQKPIYWTSEQCFTLKKKVFFNCLTWKKPEYRIIKAFKKLSQILKISFSSLK